MKVSFLGRSTLGRTFLGWGPSPGSLPPPAPIVPTNEAVNWIADRLKMGVLIGHLPQNGDDFPIFSYTLVGGSTPTELGGAIGLRRWDVQFDCWSRDASQVLLAQAKLFALLARYRGPMGRTFCQVALAGQTRTSYFPDVAGGDAGFYRASSDWSLWLNG